MARALVSQGPLECPEFAVGFQGLLQLGFDQIRPRPAEAVALDEEAADVAQLELAELAQVARAAAHLRTRARGGRAAPGCGPRF